MAKNRISCQLGPADWSWQAVPSDGAVIAETSTLVARVGSPSVGPVVVLIPAAALAPESLAALQRQLFQAACELARAALAPPRHERLMAGGWN